jgi:hypothetical protein
VANYWTLGLGRLIAVVQQFDRGSGAVKHGTRDADRAVNGALTPIPPINTPLSAEPADSPPNSAAATQVNASVSERAASDRRSAAGSTNLKTSRRLDVSIGRSQRFRFKKADD